MPLNNLVIETDYFTQIQNRNGLMKAVDFDFQFNNIAHYINNEIVPLLQRFASDTTPGSQNPNLANNYLRNVGDGTTEWAKLVYNDIPDYSLSYDKLVQTNPCSVLATNGNETFVAVTAQVGNRALISRNGNTPVWDEITSDNIVDRQITDQKIALGSLLARNFAQGILEVQLNNDSIVADNIVDFSIGTDALADGSIDETIINERSIDEFCGNKGRGIKRRLQSDTMPDNIINNVIFLTAGFNPPPNTKYAIDHTNFRGAITDVTKYANYFGGQNLDDECIDENQIEPNSLHGSRLFRPQNNNIWGSAIPTNDMLEDQCIHIGLFPDSYKVKLGL